MQYTLRRGSVAVAMLAAGSLALAACSGGSGGSESSSGSATVTLTYMTSSPEATIGAEKDVIATFEQANPTIKINVDAGPLSNYDTQLVTAFKGGNGPDIFWVNHPNVQAWANAGYLADLTALANDSSQFQKDKFIPGLLQIGTVGGKQYTLPVNTDARVFWYNTALFKKVGLVDSSGNPKVPTTWAEMQADAALFKKAGVYGFAYRSDSDYAMAYEAVGPFMKTAGGEILSSDATAQAIASQSAGTVAAVTLLQDLVKAGVTPPGESKMNETTMNKLFASDELAMMLGGPWERPSLEQIAPDFKFGTDYGVADVPVQQAGDKTASTSGGWQLGVNAKSANPAAAEKFAAFFETPENLQKLAVAGSFPPTIDGLSQAPFSSDPFYIPFMDVLPNSGLPIPPVAQMAQVSAAFEKYAMAAINDGKSVSDQLSAFDNEVNSSVLGQ